jgi:hypothetical protein
MQTRASTLTTRLIALLLGSALGCTGGDSAAPSDEKGKPVEQVVERGPIKVTSRVDSDKASVVDLITLELVVEAAKGIEVRLPERDHVERLGQKGLVRDSRSAGTQTYQIEALVSGTLELPSLQVQYKDRRQATKAQAPGTQPEADWPHMESKALTVRITSVAPEDADPTQIADIAGVATPPAEPISSRVWVFATIVGAVLLVWGVFVWKAFQRKAAVRRAFVAAHVRALEELERIVAMDLVEQGLIEEFYFRVSGVLRQYIEDRFRLRAPERTTAEFLAELTASDRFSAEQKDLLAQFLQHCDMVKFARYGPADSEVQSTFDVVRHFITATQQAVREAVA